LRHELHRVRQKLSADKYLADVSSISKSLRAFHAKDDCPEVRHEVFKAIVELPFKAQFIVARKIEKVFTKAFARDERRFYDSLLSRLFENTLHQREMNCIYYAKRGSRKRQQPLEAAIRSGLDEFERRWKTKISTQFTIQAQTPIGEPCLQIIDYMNWAVYRVFTKREMRFYDFVKEKVSLVWDVYDLGKYPSNYYSKKNPLDIKKISPL